MQRKPPKIPRSALEWAWFIAGRWGVIDGQEKVQSPGVPGYAWWFTCSESRGYVLIARKAEAPPCFSEYLVASRGKWGAYAFEDTDRIAFQAAYPGVCQWWVQMIENGWAAEPQAPTTDGKTRAFDANRTEQARASLRSPLVMLLKVWQQERTIRFCCDNLPESIGCPACPASGCLRRSAAGAAGGVA